MLGQKLFNIDQLKLILSDLTKRTKIASTYGFQLSKSLSKASITAVSRTTMKMSIRFNSDPIATSSVC